uniref:IMD domain-containing protein n=1 Tax=Electrophorus electricus TaxID=8005 RepID=A0AAY5F6J4_ELEEL
MEAVIEKECSALGGLFQAIIADMKASYPVWEDFISKAGKLQCQLRTTAVAVATFLDAFQKVADLATSTKGGTRDIGSALTRMCMRHRSIEAKLRHFSMAFVDCLISPLQEQLEDWKRGANTLDKDHAKEYKKARQEIKKKSSDTLKLQKKAKKGRGDIQPQLDSAVQDVNDKYLLLEETEKQAVRRVLVEERARFCGFVSMLRPVDEEMSMLSEIIHLQTIADDLKTLTMDPHKLPPASEQVIHDVKGSDYSWSYQTPPSSPSTTMSRKSSMCSSLNSVNSSDSRSSGSHPHSPSTHYRYRSPALTQPPPGRLASVSSHDSGFVSHDAFQSKSPSPLPPDPAPQLSNGFDRYVLGESWSRPGSVLLPDYPLYCALGSGVLPPSSKVPSWKDWAKPGPYDQPMVNTLRKRKEPREVSDHCGPGPYYQLPQAVMMEEMEAREELALALSRGLQLDTQRSSRDSLHCSSGYSTQTTTPCCSEDTIPSQAGLPSTPGPVIVTPGVATIRRTPSTKPSVRRAMPGIGPIPIKTPVIPVMTPTVPDVTGGIRTPGEEGEQPASPGSPTLDEDSEQEAALPVASWSGQASTNPPLPLGQQVLGLEALDGELEEDEDELDLAEPQGDTMLLAIRRGVKLKKTMTNDRSAPRFV